MATSLTLTAILSLLVLTAALFLISHTQPSFAANDIDIDIDNDVGDDPEEFILDNPFSNTNSRSRFLTQVIKKGKKCALGARNVCNGVKVTKGKTKSLLYCCKKHCRDILQDKNNCGRCGRKCKLGYRCCNAKCVSVAYNNNHCGKCNRKCKRGIKCEYGTCGYA